MPGMSLAKGGEKALRRRLQRFPPVVQRLNCVGRGSVLEVVGVGQPHEHARIDKPGHQS